jgi:DNA-binding NtrC family response regulator
MTRARLLVVDPEPWAVAMLKTMLQPLECELIAAASDRTALRLLTPPPALVLQAVDTADPAALELLTYVRRRDQSLPVILLLSAPHPGLAGEAHRLGATAVLPFPPPAGQLRSAVARGLDPGVAPGRTGDEVRDRPVGPEGTTVEPREGRPERAAVPCRCHTGPVGPDGAETRIGPLRIALEGPERELILQALRAFGGSRVATARALGINRTTLYKKMKKYDLLCE